jgi:protein-S-isoprenylcysteine O-methyltransferase Ste14
LQARFSRPRTAPEAYNVFVRKIFAVMGSLVFLPIAPGVVAGYVPWIISRWEFDASPLPLRWLGGIVTAIGVTLLLDCVRRFALQGIGTPAPVFPTRNLVITGMYRYVRNPMYVAVVTTILGQGLLFDNAGVLEYGAIIWLLFHAFVLIYEEPKLRATFGGQYEAFCAQVPRWIPRV